MRDHCIHIKKSDYGICLKCERHYPVVSHSKIGYVSCPRKYYLHYGLGLRQVDGDSGALHIGKLGHSLLASPGSVALEDTLSYHIVLTLIAKGKEHGFIPKNKAIVEQTLLGTVGDDVYLKGVVDRVDTGTIVEYKFTKYPEYLNLHKLEQQLAAYFLLLPQPIIRVITIRIPRLRKSEWESEQEFIERLGRDIDSRPRHYFDTTDYRREEIDLPDWELCYRAIGTMIRDMIKHGEYPRIRQACILGCEYEAICSFSLQELESEALSGFTRVKVESEQRT